MSGVLSTATSGIDAAGEVAVYVPPEVTMVSRGFNVVYGTYVPYNAGDQMTLSGTYQIGNGSGLLLPVTAATYRTVTIVAPTGAEDSGDVEFA